MKHQANIIPVIVAAAILLSAVSCKDYLNVVPDGVASIETAFSTRTNAEKFLFSCYNVLPDHHNVHYVANLGSDEFFWDVDRETIYNSIGAKLFRGEQSASSPLQNYWSASISPWVGIRDCNIFLENIGHVPDLKADERIRWIAEVKFLKAYFHFFMMELYGPVPIIDANLDMEAPTEDVRVFRRPVDEVVDYVVNLLDDCYSDLPDYIEDTANETGRITKSICKAVKAKVLVWAASPLFNGNPDYANFTNKDGELLVATTYDASKWERARDAVEDAIYEAEGNGHALYSFKPGFVTYSDHTLLNFTLRGIVTEKVSEGGNMESIWPCTKGSVITLQNYCCPVFHSNYAETCELCAPLKIAEQYYSDNGVPIDEDPDFAYSDRYGASPCMEISQADYIKGGEVTANLNYHREPRFYAHLAFDRSIWQTTTLSESEFPVIRARSGEQQGYVYKDAHVPTGYFIKKLVSFRSSTSTVSPTPYKYNIPLIRLADLYLLYAETLNECKDAPDSDVYFYIDKVRSRAGLDGVVASWRNHSIYPDKPSTKEGMREIIKRERMIELAFEGQRFFDLRRWRDAMEYNNQEVRGWDYKAQKADDYYNLVTYYSNRKYKLKDYLWPIRISDLDKNPNLVQNPGW